MQAEKAECSRMRAIVRMHRCTEARQLAQLEEKVPNVTSKIERHRKRKRKYCARQVGRGLAMMTSRETFKKRWPLNEMLKIEAEARMERTGSSRTARGK